MDIIENIKETVTRTSKAAAKKTKDLADLAKITAQIEENKNLINSVYEEIGRKYCELFNKDTAAEDFAVDVATVENLNEQIAALDTQRLALKGKVKCPVCGALADEEFAFCPRCGAKLPEKPVVEVLPAEEPEIKVEIVDADEEIVDEAEEIVDAAEEIIDEAADIVTEESPADTEE